MEADVSSRHISFLETGRAQPSSAMVRHLSDILEVPQARRNELFHAAGFAPQHARSLLSDDHMQMVSKPMAQMLDRHAPYPAVVLDPVWCLMQLNGSAKTLFDAAGLGPGASLLEFVTTPGRAKAVVENWGEVGHHMLQRLRNESRAGGGLRALDVAAQKLASDPDVAAYTPPNVLPPIVTTIYRVGPLRLAMFSTIVQFGGAEDLAISDLKIELMFPADADAETTLRVL